MKNKTTKPKQVLFIDRDGTLIQEPAVTFQIDSLDKVEFLPYMLSSLRAICRTGEYELVMVTNQDGLGTKKYPKKGFDAVQQILLTTLKNEGITFSAIHIDTSFEKDNSPNRKPRLGMLKRYLNDKYDLKNSWVIGDRKTDIQMAKNLGTGSILVRNKLNSKSIFKGDLKPDVDAKDWRAVEAFLSLPPRSASFNRMTSETNIEIELLLDGTGKSKISTGLRFFDHMLEQIAKHGSMDLFIKVKGDLDIDEHHTIEDVGITLGETFRLALGDKRGINRYGFLLPMDDCLAQVAVDFGGRNWLVWKVDFKREMIGEVPTEMFEHFFKSFSDAARCNLNIKAEGKNEHHKIEAVFKAFAKAVKMAVRRESGSKELPTTKGML